MIHLVIYKWITLRPWAWNFLITRYSIEWIFKTGANARKYVHQKRDENKVGRRMLLGSYYIKTAPSSLTLFHLALIFKREKKKWERNRRLEIRQMEEAPLKQKKKSKAWRFVYVLFSSLHQNFEMVKLSRWKMKANFFAVEKNRKGKVEAKA